MREKNQRSINLIHFRKLHKMSQAQLAETLGIPRERYAKYENNTDPPLDILAKLKAIYGFHEDPITEAKEYVSQKPKPELLTFGDIAPSTTENSPEVTEILAKIDSLPSALKRKVYEEVINKISEN